MSVISDNNFRIFLNENLNLNDYVLTDSLEPIERNATFTLFMRSKDLNRLNICDKIEKKFEAFAVNFRPLSNKEKEQAVKNLEVMKNKFTGSVDDIEGQKCGQKIEGIINKIINPKPENAEPYTPSEPKDINGKPLRKPIASSCDSSSVSDGSYNSSSVSHGSYDSSSVSDGSYDSSLVSLKSDIPLLVSYTSCDPSSVVRQFHSSSPTFYETSPFKEDNSPRKRRMTPLSTIEKKDSFRSLTYTDNEQNNPPQESHRQNETARKSLIVTMKDPAIPHLDLNPMQSLGVESLQSRTKNAFLDIVPAQQTFMPSKETPRDQSAIPRRGRGAEPRVVDDPATSPTRDQSVMRRRIEESETRVAPATPPRDQSVMRRRGRGVDTEAAATTPPKETTQPKERTRRIQLT